MKPTGDTATAMHAATGGESGNGAGRGGSDFDRMGTTRRDVTQPGTAPAAQRSAGPADATPPDADAFLTTMSHELRTPLNSILGWAHMLAEGGLDAEATRHAALVIARNAEAQARIVDDLFDVSRTMMGAMRLERRTLDLRDVVEAAIHTVRPAAEAKDIALEVSRDPRAGRVVGSAERLRQIAWNLLINAVKFTPRGGRVRATLSRVGDDVQLAVSDTGEGMTADVVPHVFDRFRQADSSTTRRHGGLGMGLALVRHLVELHGGSVRAESPGRGAGSTFTVTLPSPPPPEESVTPPDDPAGPLTGFMLLLVDDDPDGLDVMRLVLTMQGADVQTAESTAAAMERLRTLWPDLVIADVEMPGEDGISLLRRAREMAARLRRRLPAIALTAYSRAQDRARILDAGFDRYLTKPVDPDDLTQAVKALLRGAESA